MKWNGRHLWFSFGRGLIVHKNRFKWHFENPVFVLTMSVERWNVKWWISTELSLICTGFVMCLRHSALFCFLSLPTFVLTATRRKKKRYRLHGNKIDHIFWNFDFSHSRRKRELTGEHFFRCSCTTSRKLAMVFPIDFCQIISKQFIVRFTGIFGMRHQMCIDYIFCEPIDSRKYSYSFTENGQKFN